MQLMAYAGNGIVIGHLLPGDSSDPVNALTHDVARAKLISLDAAVTDGQGNMVLLRCPSAWKAEWPVWGRPRGDAWLMHAVKEKLDPRRLFNPGRFVEGI
jgi:glycolate oxidase FAD binding subunit